MDEGIVLIVIFLGGLLWVVASAAEIFGLDDIGNIANPILIGGMLAVIVGLIIFLFFILCRIPFHEPPSAAVPCRVRNP